MKKAMTFILTLVLSCICLAACGSSSSGSSATNTGAGEEVVQSDATKETSSGASTQSTKANYSLENVVIVDNEYCTFTITRVDADNVWGVTLKALCENKTSDQELMFAFDNVSVNGYMIDPFWSTSVAAGKKSNSDISFSESNLKECGITSLDEVVFELRIYDYNNWLADKLVEDIFTIYPTGLTEDQINIPERPSNLNEYIAVNDDNCTFIILYQYDDSIWGYSLKCYLENKTDKNLMFSWDDVSVNGFMIDPFWSSTVSAGKRSINSINFSNSQFEENSITDVSDIEFRLNVYDSEDWVADRLVDTVFTYSPQ